MAILIFLINGRYIQIAAKIPIFEHFPTLHLSTFRCTSRNLEHFLGYRSVFCLQSRLTSCTFRVLSNTPRNIRFQKATKELEKHLPLNTSQYYKMPRPVAHPLTSNTFCSTSPLPVAPCLTFCTFLVLLNTSGRRSIQSTAGYIQRAEESTHL